MGDRRETLAPEYRDQERPSRLLSVRSQNLVLVWASNWCPVLEQVGFGLIWNPLAWNSLLLPLPTFPQEVLSSSSKSREKYGNGSLF